MIDIDRPALSHTAVVRKLSDRLIAAQRSIRVLDAIQWSPEVERAFLTARGRELPRVTRDTYAARPLRFDPESKRSELASLKGDVRRRLGGQSRIGRMMLARIRSYQGAVAMLAARGTAAFAEISRELYDEPTRRELTSIPRLLTDLGARLPAESDQLLTVNARRAGEHLAGRLSTAMAATIRIKLDDGLLADAAAGCNYIKLRRQAKFSVRDLALLEAHEGWAHLGTTLNGLRQPACRFLAKGPPMTAGMQEGLAVLCELLADASSAERIARIRNRFEAVQMAKSGGDFLDVYRFFGESGTPAAEAYQQTVRIFRGSLPAGCGPFAKDGCYALGLVRLLGLIGNCALPSAAWLFSGKFALAECIHGQASTNGLLADAAFVPPPFRDPQALTLLVGVLFDQPVPPVSLRFDESRHAPLVAVPHGSLSFQKPHTPAARSA